MALALKQQIRTNSFGTEVWITDATLAYAASVNIGGWGAPNIPLNQAALLVYIYQNIPSADGTTSSPFSLPPLTSAISYNAGDANTVQRSIGFSYHTDGHYICTMMEFGVSTNGGTSTLDGHTLVTADYFYMTGDIYVKNADTTNTKITDYSLLPAIGSIVKVTGDVIFFNKLSLKDQLEYYRDYREARNANDVEAALDLRNKMDELEIDMAGANWVFAAGMFTQAENIVAELLEKNEIPPP